MGKGKEIINQELQNLNDELENYFANTIIPQLFIDASLILKKFTPAAAKLFSLTHNDIGKHMQELDQHIRYNALVDNTKEVIATGTILEKEIQTTDKKWFQVNILPYIVFKENKTNGVIITFVDITNRIIALDEMAKLNKGYETFIYGVVHDIKQPLAKMVLIPDLLATAQLSGNKEDFAKWIELLKKSSKNINELLNNFTAYVNNKTEILTVSERVGIEDIFTDVQLALKEEITRESVTVETQFKTSEITFSRTGLRSILYNLVSNAIKYKKAGQPSKITVSTIKTKEHVLLSVKDNGLGIAEDDQERVFNKFTRLSHSVEGTGMGLFVIKNMVENNGGKVEVNSIFGSGSTFTVYFKTA